MTGLPYLAAPRLGHPEPPAHLLIKAPGLGPGPRLLRHQGPAQRQARRVLSEARKILRQVGYSHESRHVGRYADWAMRHDSLLILTWDEDDGSQGNHVTTIFAGQMVRPGRYGEPITDYTVLATIEAAYMLPRDARAAAAAPMITIWLL